MSANAYIWRREFCSDQYWKILKVRRAREYLKRDVLELSRYCRLQLMFTDQENTNTGWADGPWKGKDAHYELEFKSVFFEMAVDIFSDAIKDAIKYYPNFNRHHFEDGSLIGERKIVFPDQLDEAVICWLTNRVWKIAESGKYTLREKLKVHKDRYTTHEDGRPAVIAKIGLAKECIDKQTVAEFEDALKNGKPLPVDTNPIKLDPNSVLNQLALLSSSELVLLNWEDARKKLTNPDTRLFKAIKNADIKSLKAALADGADPNAISKEEYTPVLAIVENCCRYHKYHEPYEDRTFEQPAEGEIIISSEQAIEMIDILVDAGAAVNCYDPEEGPPIAHACLNCNPDIIEHLLKHGADPSIRTLDQCGKYDWGEGWEYAYFRRDPNINHHDESTWQVLLERFKKPFGELKEG